MGLLDGLSGLVDLNNPQVLNAYRLLAAKQGELGGLLGQFGQEAEQRKARALQEQIQRQQMEAHQMQMDQQRRQAGRQEQIDALAPRFQMPGNLAPNDDEGNAMPQAPQGFDAQGYARALSGIDPMAGIGLQAQLAGMNAKNYQKLGEGESLFDVSNPSAPIAQGTPKSRGPQPGATREIKSGGNLFTYEWDGQKWNKIAEAPQFKPDGPDKPPAPQLYNGPSGPVWVTPPTRGQAGTLPVTDPSGKPIGLDKSASEAELTAAGYGGRMQAAEATLGKVGEAGQPSKMTTAAQMLPLKPEKQRFLERQIQSPEQQQYRQAQEDWVRAKLRKESGAVIADEEMRREIETYFPQLGDSPQVVKQKAAARQTAMRAMSVAAGKAGGRTGEVAGWSIKALD